MNFRTSMAKHSKITAKHEEPALRTAFARLGERMFCGFVVDIRAPARKFVVDLLVDGHPVRTTRADAYVHELAVADVGDGCYGFSFSLPDTMLGDDCLVEARLANLGTSLGAPIAVGGSARIDADPAGPGLVRWQGGLRFTGWMAQSDEDASADVLVDGALIMRVRPSGWTHVGATVEEARAVRAVDLNLPERFADGRLHWLTVTDARGENFAGSPIGFVAFADGLERTIARLGDLDAERVRGEVFDRLLPMSLPFSYYQSWRERFPVPLPELVAMRGAVIMVGRGEMDDTLASLDEQTHAEWVAAALPETAEHAGFHPEHARAFLARDAAACDFVVFGWSGTSLAPSALQRIAGAFAAFERAQAVYGDLDIASGDGSLWPLAMPAFDYERMLEQGYCAHLFALRRAAAERALASGAANLYRLFNALLDDGTTSADAIVHLPGALGAVSSRELSAAAPTLAAATRAHLRRRGIDAQVTPAAGALLPAVRVSRNLGETATTIVIPTRDRHELLRSCIESIRPAAERRSAEIIVVDNDSSDPDCLEYLAQIDGNEASVLRLPGPFNYARLNNAAAEAARGDVLCLLNNDIKALDDAWLDELLGRLAEPDVGAVGALLLWPSGIVQHGGVVLGPKFAAIHAFNDRISNDPGYGDLLRVAHECSAVTAACLVTRRSDYLAVGGLDEIRFPVNFNDVDYCLKLRAAGKRVVLTPHARLLHFESASRGSDKHPDRRSRFERELQNLRAKWPAVLADDPYYSPVLSLDDRPFSALAWPAREMTPRLGAQLSEVPVPPGF